VTVVFIAGDDSFTPVSPATRVRAWLYTGPFGHLYGGLADWSELMARYWWSRARVRMRGR
jgi:hypothetical protein